jgi:hypothetical protein
LDFGQGKEGLVQGIKEFLGERRITFYHKDTSIPLVLFDFLDESIFASYQ